MSAAIKSLGSEAAQAAAKEAAEKAAKEAAQAAVKEAVESAAKQAAEKAAKEAAQAAAKEAIEAAAREAAQAATKEAAEAAAKKAGSTAAKEAAQAAAKDAGEMAAKESAGDVAKMGAKEAAQSAGEKSLAWVRRNPKLILGGVAAATLAGLALDRFLKTNDQKRTITSITHSSKGLSVKYTPPLDISSGDSLTLSETNSVPAVDGRYDVIAVTSDSEVTVNNVVTLSVDGTSGTFTVHTTFGTQLLKTLGDAAEAVGDVGKTTVDGLWNGLGLPDLSSVFSYIPYIVGGVLLIVGVVLVIMIVKKRRESQLSPWGQDYGGSYYAAPSTYAASDPYASSNPGAPPNSAAKAVRR